MVTFPSIQPHFARPIMEAGAMSKPVVASSIGGITEILSNERNGLLVAPKDSNALAEAFITLIEDESLAKKMGAVDNSTRNLKEAVEETNAAILKVLNGSDKIVLSPQNSYIRKLQHQMGLRQKSIITESIGEGKSRRAALLSKDPYQHV